MNEHATILQTKKRKENRSSKLSLEAFDVFSNVEELITLENGAIVTLKAQDIPLKREGMKSSNDLILLLKKITKI